MQHIYLPFTIDKRFWNKKMPNVFLNKVYEQQLDESDRGLHYNTIEILHHRNDLRCKKLIDRLTEILGHILNQYHGLNETTEFWNKILWFWIKEYVCSIQFKIDQMNLLKKEYPTDSFFYHSYASTSWRNFNLLALEDSHNGIFFEEIYHFISYLWLAERFYNVKLEEIDINLQYVKRKENKTINSILRNMRDKISDFWEIFPSRMKVAIYGAQQGRFSCIKWSYRSKGAIGRMVIQPVHLDNIQIDKKFRDQLKNIIIDYIEPTEDERIILGFLPKVFPRFFVEDFKAQYEQAQDYIDTHPNLSVIFTGTCIVEKSMQKICMLLLQRRGGKVLGQQHGGSYQITSHAIDYLHELEMNDLFYFWGRGILNKEDVPKKVSYAPSWKLARNIKGKNAKRIGNYILFIETAIEAYPRSYHYGNFDADCLQYINWEQRFFNTLQHQSNYQLFLRPYLKDYGWHVQEMVKKFSPELKIKSEGDFYKLLNNCSLLVVDHISTTWMEALYINKPIIIFIPHYSSVTDHEFREDEKIYFDMLEEVGIVFYSPEEAAIQVNQIVKQGIMNWWLDETRQQTVQMLRERWITEVENIDDWWYRELMTQANNDVKNM